MMVNLEKLLLMKFLLCVKLLSVSYRTKSILFSVYLRLVCCFLVVYGEESNYPKLTFLVVKKRHHTRFFSYNEKSNQTNNMAIGTIIDTTIVHPRQFDFYLNSHAGALGTNVCSYYHVLYNEIEFTSDELQQLTFWVNRFQGKINRRLLGLFFFKALSYRCSMYKSSEMSSSSSLRSYGCLSCKIL